MEWLSSSVISSRKAGRSVQYDDHGGDGDWAVFGPSDINTTTCMPYYSWCNYLCTGHFVARSYTGIGGSTQIGKHINFARLGSTTNASWSSSYGMVCGGGATGIVYPSP